MQDTIIMTTTQKISASDRKRVAAICSDEDATFVWVDDRRVSHHTGWVTYRNLGAPFTTNAAARIRSRLDSEGIAF